MYYRGGNETEHGRWDVSLVTNQIFQVIHHSDSCFEISFPLQFVAVFTGFGGMYITDNKGIKTAGMIGTSLNVIGATVRMISSVPYIESKVIREMLLHTGSFIAASAQAFFLVLPSKIAECWFPADQRAIANVLSFVGTPIF